MRFYIIMICILLIMLLGLAFLVNVPMSKTFEEKEYTVEKIVNNISFAEIFLLIEKMEKIEEERVRYTQEDRLSMEEKLAGILDNESLYQGDLAKEGAVSHSGIYLTFAEMAALFDITIKSIREMTLVRIDVEQLCVVEQDGMLYVQMSINADISGLLHAIKVRPDKKIQILFAVNAVLARDKTQQLRAESLDIQSINLLFDSKFLEYGCYYIFATPDYNSVVSNIIVNVFNNLGNTNVMEEGIYFE